MISLLTFRKEIKSTIIFYSAQLIKGLGELSSLSFNPKVSLIDFELFIETARFEVDIMMFSMSNTGDEVFNDNGKEHLNYFAGSKQILTKAKFYCGNDKNEILNSDESFLKSADEVVETVFMDWFLHCWENSSCKNVNLPMYVGIHDYQKSFYLQQKKWVDLTEKFLEY